MTTTYTPDRWGVVVIKTPTQECRKVLASWYGGYLGSDERRVSSGNRSAIEHSDHWEFPQISGSTYICYKNRYGMTGYTASIYYGLERRKLEEFSTRIATEYEPIE